jgi:hypothetical protein
MTKTVLASKFQEWKGLDRISLVVHEMKCIFREITKDDFGIDGEIEIVVPKPEGEGFQTTGGIIKVQAKSGMSYVKQDSDSSFATPVSRSDLDLWYNANFSTAFIVYHPDDDTLYWKEIRSYVRNTPNVWSPPFRVVFNKATDQFTPDCFDSLCALADVSPPRVSSESRERLFSNLLRVQRLPWVWSASTEERSYQGVRRSIQGFVPPFTLIGGRLHSLSNLNDEDCVLRSHCDTSDIRFEKVESWWDDEDRRRQYVFLLNQLLGIHLRRLGIRYSKRFRRNFFPREDDDSLEFKREWYNARTRRSAQRTVVQFYEYGYDRFWRHRAVELTFRMIGTAWFLQIDPKYFFTEDGRSPYDSSRVGALTTKVKARETNLHVLNDVLFWSDILSGAQVAAGADAIKIRLDRRAVMIVDRLPALGIASFSIPFDPAIYEEPDSTVQLRLLDLLEQQSEDDDEY